MQLVRGNHYFVRTPSGIDYVGKLAEIDGPFTITLTQASWVSDSGRLGEFMREGRTSNMEIEPIGEIMIHFSAIAPWNHKLFTEAV